MQRQKVFVCVVLLPNGVRYLNRPTILALEFIVVIQDSVEHYLVNKIVFRHQLLFD